MFMGSDQRCARGVLKTKKACRRKLWNSCQFGTPETHPFSATSGAANF